MKIANKEMKKQYKGIDIDKIEVSLAQTNKRLVRRRLMG